MQQRRYLNPSQPQTLQIAVMLLYINGFFAALYLILDPDGQLLWLQVAMILGQIGAGFGIANERKWGYALGIAMSILPFAVQFLLEGNPFAGFPILSLMFQIALVALLLHPQSREYQRIWFK